MPTTKSKVNKKNQKGNTHLHPTSVFIRIRPLAESGGHAEDTNHYSSKHLEAWDEQSVTLSTQYLFSKGNARYNFPARVWGPETTQKDVYETPSFRRLVDEFVAFEGRNVVAFAYGQTGTGKTHTTLGTDKSLLPRRRSTPPMGSENSTKYDDVAYDDDDGWGIFPRVFTTARATLIQKNHHNTTKTPFYIFTASAIEFYLADASDLLQPQKNIRIDPDSHRPCGCTTVVLSSVDDMISFLNTVRQNRTTRSTRMNRAHETHGGSSRSHAALILTLHQLDSAVGVDDGGGGGDNYCQTTFTIVDLAGAERPSKTKEKRYGGIEMALWMKEYKGEEIPVGCQALVINLELSSIASEVLRATGAHRQGKPYTPPRQLCTETIKFLGGCFDGDSITAMILCLSPAGSNGWETWFSLQYGEKVSRLKVPVRRQRAKSFKRVYRNAEKKAKDAAEALKRANVGNKYYVIKETLARDAQQGLEQLERLRCLLRLDF
mmetsp:Transcript_49094/g.59477  ORF Transcript_49094/g.59477 Transcript_49094/m.59477 type:complete len:490 (+) Transcript_49094:15-1484(+)